MQSSFFKPAVSGLICVVLLLLILYIATRPVQSPSTRSTPVRLSSPLVSIDSQKNLTVLPTLGPSSSRRKSDEAYVALQYGSFFLALRVLGQSLRESGTERDMVALVMSDVPKYKLNILKKDGWIVRTVDPLPTECIGEHMYSKHFIKIQSWLLTEYKRIVLIDSDAIVLKNIDNLFNCGVFCAAYRHSDLFNTGVVALKPSEDTFKKICSKIQSFGSFTNGDQGFLNYFFKDLKKAPMFGGSDEVKEQQFQRLPAEYNGDVSVYYLTNQWMYLDTDEPYVLHYTLGPVKPWIWWTYPLFSLNWRWKELRDRLPPTQLREPTLLCWNSLFPLVVLLTLGLSINIWHKHYTNIISKCTIVRWMNGSISPSSPYCTNILPLLMFLLACYCAFSFVPQTMNPVEAYTRYGLWILLLFTLPFSVYCHLVYIEGMSGTVNSGSSPTHVKTISLSTITRCRILGEGLLWLMLSVILFYMQFSITMVQVTMKRRVISFFLFALGNLILCYWYGKRFTALCKPIPSSQLPSP